MIDLDAIRARADTSAKAVVDDLFAPMRERLTIEQVCSRWRFSAQDVPILLAEIERMNLVLEAARAWRKSINRTAEWQWPSDEALIVEVDRYELG